MKCALLIGINYIGTSSYLNGCINDICDIYRLCKKNNYSYFCVLSDDALPSDIKYKNISTLPTKENIIKEIKNFMNYSKDGDELYIHYSGHGSQIQCTTNEETDGFNEVLVPLDYQKNGIIKDNELRDIIVTPLLNKTVKLRAIFDCCHSGTILDLKYNLQLNTKRVIDLPKVIEDNIDKELINKMVKEQVTKELKKYLDDDIVDKYIKKNEDINDNINNDTEIVEINNNVKKIISYNKFINKINDDKHKLDIILLSGCSDNQTSADAKFNNKANGALTKIFIEIYENYMKNDVPNVVKFLDDIRLSIKNNKFSQIPQLSSETPFTNNRKFNL